MLSDEFNNFFNKYTKQEFVEYFKYANFKMYNIYQKLPDGLKKRFSKVVLLVLDFDGTLTNNKVYIDQTGRESVKCSRGEPLVQDLKDLAKVDTLILSREDNLVTGKRAEKLGIMCVQGLRSKIEIFNKEIEKRGLKKEHVCYVGNDWNDAECIKAAGVGVAVSDAYWPVQNIADYTTHHEGGKGAVREVCELILFAKGVHPHQK